MWRVWELYAERAWYSEDNREVSYEALNGDDDPFAEGESSSLIASPLSPELIKAELCNWKLESKEINKSSIQIIESISRLMLNKNTPANSGVFSSNLYRLFFSFLSSWFLCWSFFSGSFLSCWLCGWFFSSSL